MRRLVKLGIDKRDPDALTADEIRSVSFALSHPSNHVECFFLHSNPYGSPLLESLPSWTSTRARSPGRGFWTPTTGRFDLYTRVTSLTTILSLCRYLRKITVGQSPTEKGLTRSRWFSNVSFHEFHFCLWLDKCVVTGRLSSTSLWPGEIVFDILT